MPKSNPKSLKIRIAVPAITAREGPGWNHQLLDLQFTGNEVHEVLNVAGKDAWVEIAPGAWIPAEYQGTSVFTLAAESD